jgi:hypothetical protein
MIAADMVSGRGWLNDGDASPMLSHNALFVQDIEDWGLAVMRPYGRKTWIWKLGTQLTVWSAFLVLWIITQNFLYLLLDWLTIIGWLVYVKFTYGWDQGLYAMMDADPEGPLPELPAATARRIRQSAQVPNGVAKGPP